MSKESMAMIGLPDIGAVHFSESGRV